MSFKVKIGKRQQLIIGLLVDAKHNTKIKYFKELKKSIPGKKNY